MRNTILENLEYAEDDGRLTLKGVRYLLIRPETLMAWYRTARERLGEAADDLVYQGGFEGGRLSGERFRQVFGYTAEATVDFMAEMGGQIGWGRFEVLECNPGGRRLEVRVMGSPFPDAFGPADHPVCHLIRGVLGGLGEGTFEGPAAAREVACRAMGDATCHFIVEAT
jgi:predicted hydrocarbon binding protein